MTAAGVGPAREPPVETAVETMVPRREHRRVVLAMFFLPHYRGPVVRALLSSPRHEYLLAGETADVVDGSIETWEVPASVDFIRTPYVRLFGIFGWLRGTLRLALRRDVDAIVYHADPHLLSTWVSAVLARLTGKRVLFSTIGWFHHDSRLRTLLKKVYFRIPHGLLLYGHGAKMIGLERGLQAERLYVVYNSLDYERQKEIRRRLTPERRRRVRAELFDEPGRPMIICTSRLTAKRRLDLVLEAMVHLRDDGHPVNLVLVGAGPEQDALARLARERTLAVHFFGACYDEEVLSGLIAACNVTVAPGMVGLTAMHSLAYGTPVITHDDEMFQSPEWEIILPGSNGGFFRRGDARDLARAIREWTESEFTTDDTRRRCHRMLDRIYNADFQRRAFDWAVGGRPADDLFWMKEDAMA